MIVRYRKLTGSAIQPTRGSSQAAGYDLYADLSEEQSIGPGETVLIGTGLCMEIPEGYFGGVFARSGLATKQGLRPANCTGVIDSDYRGEVKVSLHNDSRTDRIIRPGDRIAQLLILPYLQVSFEEAEEELTDTQRGRGGFGSTG